MSMLIDGKDGNIWFYDTEIKSAKKYYKYYAIDRKRHKLTDWEKAFNKRLAKCKTLEEIAELYNAEHPNAPALIVR